MTGEGVLYRKIRSVFPELKLKVETWIIPDIEKVLDEAKQDMVKVLEVLRRYNTIVTEDDEYNNDEVVDAADLIKKWFGEEEY